MFCMVLFGSNGVHWYKERNLLLLRAGTNGFNFPENRGNREKCQPNEYNFNTF